MGSTSGPNDDQGPFRHNDSFHVIDHVSLPFPALFMVHGMHPTRLRLAVDDRILAEYTDVLRRPQLTGYFAISDIGHILEYLSGNSEHIMSTKQILGLPDPDDVPFLEVAIAAGVPLVTGNLKHFPLSCRQDCEVFLPADFLHRFS